MERHCKKCGYFATNASSAVDATCPRCGAAYPRLEGNSAQAAAGGGGPSRMATAATGARVYGGVHDAAAFAQDQAQWIRMRRAAPSNVALPRTMAWSLRLPVEVQPKALLRAFGRIANQLAANWEDAAVTFAYFDQLLVDRRGHRRGFPPDVKAELEALRRSYAVHRPGGGGPLHRQSGVWDGVRKR